MNKAVNVIKALLFCSYNIVSPVESHPGGGFGVGHGGGAYGGGHGGGFGSGHGRGFGGGHGGGMKSAHGFGGGSFNGGGGKYCNYGRVGHGTHYGDGGRGRGKEWRRYGWYGRPYHYYNAYPYYYADECRRFYRKAVRTGSPYWWQRYYWCVEY